MAAKRVALPEIFTRDGKTESEQLARSFRRSGRGQ